MVQLYFLSIVVNGLAGFLFIFGDFAGDSSAEDGMRFSTGKGGKFASVSNGFRLVLGILAALIGLLKLLLPMGIPFLGDLLPALAGMAAGFMLIFGFYREHTAIEDDEGKVNHFGEIFLHYKKAAGIALVVTAMLHFLFPRALFL